MDSSQIILITGANRGIGFAIAQKLGASSPKNTLIVAGRTKVSAEEAIAQLKRDAGVEASMHALELDVTDDATIDEAKRWIDLKFGRLDVLVNNAGIARNPDSASWQAFRSSFRDIFETNITAVAWISMALDPLLRRSAAPKVINISSGRASMSRSANKQLPPTAVIPYSISKVGLNALTLEQIKGEQSKGGGAIAFYAANPGHCKTAFNGYKGTKDPLDGAKVVVELALAAKSEYEPGFWEFEEEGMRQVPW